MSTSTYTNIFAAKEIVRDALRDMGQAPYSRLLMATNLPETVLTGVLDILKKEKKVAVARHEADTSEDVYLPVSGAWAGMTGWKW